MILKSINAILTQDWFLKNIIDVLCLFNLYIILKIVCFEQYIKRLIATKVNRLAAFNPKNNIFFCTL